MPFVPDRVPIYPRPTSPVHAESITLTRSDVSYQSSSSDDEIGEPTRAAKRRRIELCAARYLRGEPLFILSASLKGPLEGGKWVNPWIKKTGGHRHKVTDGLRSNTVRSRHNPEIPETVHCQREQARNKGADTSAATPNRRAETWLKSNDGFIKKQFEARLPSPTPLRPNHKSSNDHGKVSVQTERIGHAISRQQQQEIASTDTTRKTRQAVDEQHEIHDENEVLRKIDHLISTAAKALETGNLSTEMAETGHDTARTKETNDHAPSNSETAPSAQPLDQALQAPSTHLSSAAEISSGLDIQRVEQHDLLEHMALDDEKDKKQDNAHATSHFDKPGLEHERLHNTPIFDEFREDEILTSTSPINLASIKRAIMGRDPVDMTSSTHRPGQKATDRAKSRHKVRKSKRPGKEAWLVPQSSMKSAMKVAKVSEDVKPGVPQFDTGATTAKTILEDDPRLPVEDSPVLSPDQGQTFSPSSPISHPMHSSRGKTSKAALEHFISVAPILTAPADSPRPSADHDTTITATTTTRPGPIRRQSSRVSFAAPDHAPQPTNTTTASMSTSTSLPAQPSHQIDPNSPSRLLTEHAPPFNPSSELHQIEILPSSARRRRPGHHEYASQFQPQHAKPNLKRKTDIDEIGKEIQEGAESFDLKSAIDDLGSFLNTWDVEKDVSAISAGSY